MNNQINNEINNQIDNSLLFFKIYRNKFLNNKIINHLNLLNNHHYCRIFQVKKNEFDNINKENNNNQINQIKEYFYKDYLYSISLIAKDVKIELLLKLLHQSLLENIKELELEYVKIDASDKELKSIIINEPIVPDSITTLGMPKYFNFQIGPNTFHSNLKNLKFNYQFNKSLSSISTIGTTTTIKSYLPIGLVYLEMGMKFDQFIFPGVLPNTLRTLKLSTSFNHEILPGCLPDSLTFLDLGNKFNCELRPGVLPLNLEILLMSMAYDHHISSTEILPSKLKKLNFDLFGVYNYPIIQSTIPNSITELNLGLKFNESLAFLPDNIKKLKICGDIELGILKSISCKSLKKLSMIEYSSDLIYDGDWYSSLESTSLKKLSITSAVKLFSIPPSVTKLKGHSLYINDSNGDEVYNKQLIQALSQRPNIKHLKVFGCETEGFKQGDIPKQLNYLSLYTYIQQLDQDLLKECTELHTLILTSPEAILPNSLPQSLTTLCIDSSIFDHPFEKNSLPTNLRNLSIKSFEQPLDSSNLNETQITTLELGFEFSHTLSSKNLPPTIQTLILWGLETKLELPLPSTLSSIYIYSGNRPILHDISIFNNLLSLLKVLDGNGMSKVFKGICKNHYKNLKSTK